MSILSMRGNASRWIVRVTGDAKLLLFRRQILESSTGLLDPVLMRSCFIFMSLGIKM